jgi:hypothetical protein
MKLASEVRVFQERTNRWGAGQIPVVGRSSRGDRIHRSRIDREQGSCGDKVRLGQ